MAILESMQATATERVCATSPAPGHCPRSLPLVLEEARAPTLAFLATTVVGGTRRARAEAVRAREAPAPPPQPSAAG